MFSIARPIGCPRFLACCVAPLVLAVASDVSLAQTRSFRVRDKVVELKTATDVLLVRPKANAKAADLSEEAWRVQAQLRGVDASRIKRAGAEPREAPLLKGMIVPRMPGVKDADLAGFGGRSAMIESAEPLYRGGGQLTAPLGTITVRFRFQGKPPARFLFALAQELDLQEAARPKFAEAAIRFRPNRPDADVFEICKSLEKLPNVLWAEPDLFLEFEFPPVTVSNFSRFAKQAPGNGGLLPSRQPDDPHFYEQWHLANGDAGINVPAAWSISTGAEQMVVAVVDSGIDRKHVDLRDKLLPGYDFLDDDDDPNTRQQSHATACAGLLGAVTNNSAGVAGVAWNCRIIPVRVMDDNGQGNWPIMAEGVAYAGRSGAKIISCSIGGGFASNQMFDAIDEATAAGSLVIAAAGNANTAVHFPAAYEKCIAVGAIRPDNRKCDYSNYGMSLDIVAPGGGGGENVPGLWTTDISGPFGNNRGASGDPRDAANEPTGDYMGSFTGTSAATPVVAGVAALVWSSYPRLSAEQVRQILLETATKIDPENSLWQNGHNVFYGHGKVDAYAAMRRAAELAGQE